MFPLRIPFTDLGMKFHKVGAHIFSLSPIDRFSLSLSKFFRPFTFATYRGENFNIFMRETTINFL